MGHLPDISRSDFEALANLQQNLEGKGHIPLDPGNATHRAAIDAALRAADRTSDRYPALHESLDGQRGTSQGAETARLVDSGRDRGGRATAQMWHTADGAPLFMGSALFALDHDKGSLIGFGKNSSLKGFLATSTDTASARQAPGKFGVLGISHVSYPDGTTRFAAMSTQATASDNGDADVTVTQPVITVQGHTEIVIALGRTSASTNPDADYTFVEPQNVSPPYLIVPFEGQAGMPYQIDGTKGDPVSGAVLTTQIYFVKVDDTTITIALNDTYTDPTRFADGVTVNPDDDYILLFSYPADGNSYNDTTSLVYDKESLTNEQISYFFFEFQIPVVNAPVQTYTFAVCSKNTPNEPSVQCVQIDNLMFWWHCLAAGTRVRMSDGSEAAIETLDNTHRVQTAYGGHLAVEATSKGPHSGNSANPGPGAVYRLRTKSGHELVATGSHPIVTPVGLVAIADLSPGQSVLVENGVSAVDSIQAVDHEGEFFNLKLGNQEDRAAGGGALLGTYLANGIAVGDHAAMAVHADHRRADLDFMLPRLPEAQRQDYASAVEDVRY